MTTLRNKETLWLMAIILIAFALRLHNLTYHSLWFDEAMSVHWARQSVPRILEVGFTLVEDRLPPLYYLTLKGWSGLFGFSETSVRMLTVFFGVLLVPVIANLAGMLFNRRVALLTALLVALNPFLIWYAQEARMYAPAALFSALSVWAFLGMVKQANKQTTSRFAASSDHQPPPPTQYAIRNTHHAPRTTLPVYQILFILSAIAGLYSHLYAGFLLPALGLWLIISYPRAWRLWLRFALSGLIIILAFAPITLAIWRFSGEATPGQPFTGLDQRVWQLLQAFTLWQAPLSPIFQIAIPLTTLLLVLCAYLKPGRHSQSPISQSSNLPISNLPISQSPIPHPLLLTSLLLISPFLIASLLLFRNHLAFFGERYFIVMVPWLLLLAAAGVDNLSRVTEKSGFLRTKLSNNASQNKLEATFKQPSSKNRVFRPSRFTFYALRCLIFPAYLLSHAPALLLILATILPIPGQWSLPAAKESWRQSVAYLAEHVRPNHGILIHPDWARYPFQYYFQGPGQTYAAFSNVTPETALDGPLQGVVGQHPVIWLIQSHVDSPDPERLVEQWFATRYPLVTELYPPGISLKGYAPGYQLESLPPEATPVDFRFENGLQLSGYQAETTAAARDDFFHPPSGWLHVTLYWSAGRPIETEAVPYVHLVGPEGVWGVNLERANDALKLYPPARWSADPDKPAIIRHDVDVNLNPVTPPGRYQLVVGMQGEETQYTLTTVDIQ